MVDKYDVVFEDRGSGGGGEGQEDGLKILGFQ